MPLPTFIVIGPGKTGTTWLYRCLLEHPEIGLAKGTKETLFFNHNYDKGLLWYEKFFDGLGKKRAIGEISNDYFFSSEAPKRIATALPGIKLITILRNPVDRIVSMYQFNIRNGNFRKWYGDRQAKLEETLDDVKGMRSQNRYREHLENYLRHFPREQIYVGLFDDITSSPEMLISEIYSFIGVDSDFRPKSLRERVLPASQARFGKDLSYAKRIARWLRSWQLHALLTWAKTNPIVLRVLTKPTTDKIEISKEAREKLRTEFDPHIRFVENLVGRNLEHWK
jgi:Sulfotransferase domain